MSEHDDDKEDANNTTDIREAAYLRFRFQDATTVSSIWKYLQKANWTYHPGQLEGQYKAPGSGVLLDSNSVLKKLDETAIPMLNSYLEFPLEDAQQANNNAISNSSQELRRQMIDQLQPKLIAAYTEIEVEDKKQASTKNNDAEGLLSRKRPTRERRQVPNNKNNKRSNKSIVSADAGADLYTNPPKRQKSKGETHAMEFPSPQQIAEMFRQNKHRAFAEFEKDFLEWKFLLSTNHSLLFYGFGSKRNLLNQFAKETLEPAGDVLAIDGFDQDVTVERILDLMVTVFLNNEEPELYSQNDNNNEGKQKKIGVYPSIPLISENIDLTRATAISRAIAKIQTNRKRPLYLIIHNIDTFRSRPAQDALAALLIHSTVTDNNDIRTIRLVASIDHVNTSTLLWDPATSSNFSFLWQEVHTFEPYIEELKRGRMEKIKGRTGKRTLTLSSSTPASIQDVLYTIAPRHTEVLQVLVKLQTATANTKKKGKDVKFQSLLQDCQNQCIVFSDSQLRQYLTELVDHGLIEKRQEKGTEYLKVPHDASCVEVIMNFKSN